MSYRSYLSQSPSGSYYFRLRLNSSAAERLGVKEVRRSLQTSNRMEARRKALELFEAVRQVSMNSDDSNAPQSLLRRFRPIRVVLQPEGHVAANAVSIEEGLRRYRTERVHLWTPKTAQEVESIIRRFNIAKSTGRADAVRHKGRLSHLHPKTQNKHLQRLRDVFEFLRTNGYVQTENPFRGLRCA